MSGCRVADDANAVAFVVAEAATAMALHAR